MWPHDPVILGLHNPPPCPPSSVRSKQATATPNPTASGGGGHSPEGPQAAGGGGAGAGAGAGPWSDGAEAARRVAGPCEAAGRQGPREPQGSESRAQMGRPAAPHPLQEPPARAPVPQQHLRGEHQESTELGARGGGSGGAKAAGDPPRARGGAPATPPAPLPPPAPPCRCPWC